MARNFYGKPMDCESQKTQTNCDAAGRFQYNGSDYEDCTWVENNCMNRHKESCRSFLSDCRFAVTSPVVDGRLLEENLFENRELASCEKIDLHYSGHGMGHVKYIDLVSKCYDTNRCNINATNDGCSTFSKYTDEYEQTIKPILENLIPKLRTQGQTICLEGNQCISAHSLNYDSRIKFTVTGEEVQVDLSLCHENFDRCSASVQTEVATCKREDQTITSQRCCNARKLIGQDYWIVGTPCPEKIPSDLLKTKVEHGRTPLHLALYRGQLEQVKNLVEMDPTLLKEKDTAGYTPIALAAHFGKLNQTTIEALLKGLTNEVEKDSFTLSTYIPIEDLGAIRGILTSTRPEVGILQGSLKAIRLLLAEKKVKVEQIGNHEKSTLPHLAAQLGNEEIMRALLADPKVNPDQVGLLDGWSTPLYVAVQNDHDQVVGALLSDPRVDPNQVNEHGATALLIAAQKDHTEVVRAFLANKRVNPNQVDNAGKNALHEAARIGHLDIIRLLLADPRVNPDLARKNGMKPLHVAAQEGHHEIVRALVDLEMDSLVNLQKSRPNKFLSFFRKNKVRMIDNQIKEKKAEIQRQIDIAKASPIYLKQATKQAQASAAEQGLKTEYYEMVTQLEERFEKLSY